MSLWREDFYSVLQQPASCYKEYFCNVTRQRIHVTSFTWGSSTHIFQSIILEKTAMRYQLAYTSHLYICLDSEHAGVQLTQAAGSEEAKCVELFLRAHCRAQGAYSRPQERFSTTQNHWSAVVQRDPHQDTVTGPSSAKATGQSQGLWSPAPEWYLCVWNSL